MQYAVFEFLEDKSCEVGETNWINGEDDDMLTNEKWFFNKEIVVEWPCDSRVLKRLPKNMTVDLHKVETKMHPAKVVKFGGKFTVENYLYFVRLYIHYIICICYIVAECESFAWTLAAQHGATRHV